MSCKMSHRYCTDESDATGREVLKQPRILRKQQYICSASNSDIALDSPPASQLHARGTTPSGRQVMHACTTLTSQMSALVVPPVELTARSRTALGSTSQASTSQGSSDLVSRG